MNLAIHCAGDITTVGIEKEEQIEFINIPSKYLFSNPNIFALRLYEIISDNLSLPENSIFENIVVSISGEFKGNKLLLSDYINYVSLSDAFTGFDFEAALNKFSNNIFLVNDMETYSHGIISTGILDTYSLLLVKDHFVGSSYIIKDDFALLNWNQLRTFGSQFNPNKFIGNTVIDDILFDDIIDIKKKFTEGIIDLSSRILTYLDKNSVKIQNIVFLSEDSLLVDKNKLISDFPDINFYIDKLYKSNYSIQMKGCFTFLKTKKNSFNFFDSIANFFDSVLPLDFSFLQKAFDSIGNKKVEEVTYYSEEGKELRQLTKESELLLHFNETKPFANPDNYYLFNFDDNQKLKVKLRHIDEENFLKKINF